MVQEPFRDGRGSPRKQRIVMTEEQYARLKGLLKDEDTREAEHRAIRLILRIVVGHSVTDAASWVGLQRCKAYKWLHRWHENGVDGLRDRRRYSRGRPTKGNI